MNTYEQYKTKRNEKEVEKVRRQRKKKITQFVLLGAGIIALGGMVMFAVLKESNQSLEQQSEVISKSGLHWHPELEIYVKGEKIEIPHNIGLAGVHKPMHTHEDLPIIHLEYSGRVTQDDIKLGNFFRIWGKAFMEFGTSVQMTVNGIENTQLEEYQMQDGDRIELRYE